MANNLTTLLQDVSRTEMDWRRRAQNRRGGFYVTPDEFEQKTGEWLRHWRFAKRTMGLDQLDDNVTPMFNDASANDPLGYASRLRRELSNVIAQGRSVGVIKTDAKKSAALASQIETRVNAWRHRAPGKGDAIKSIDGWIKDAALVGDEAAVAALQQAVAEAERIGTVKAAVSWGGVITGVDEAVKSLRGTVKAFGNPSLNEAGKRIIWAATMFEGGEPTSWKEVPGWLSQAVSFVTKATAELIGSANHTTLLRREVLPRIRKAALLYETADANPQSAQTAARELRKARSVISDINGEIEQGRR